MNNNEIIPTKILAVIGAFVLNIDKRLQKLERKNETQSKKIPEKTKNKRST